MNKLPNVPYPPTDGAMNSDISLVFLIAMWVIAGVFFVLSLRSYRKTGSPVFLLCLLGGGFCVFMEPIVDVLGLCWFWEEGNWVLGEWLGRFIPVWMLPVYIWFVGGQCYYTLTRLEKGMTAAGMWKLYGAYMLMNIMLEEPPLHLGLYTYYGAQPLQLGLLPLWWVIVNAAMPIVAATAVYKLKPYLKGWHIIALVPTIPMADAITNAAIAWPVWLTLNSSDSLVVTHFGALTTAALAALMFHYLTLMAATDSPAPRLGVKS